LASTADPRGVRPDDQRHPQPLGIGTHLPVLGEVGRGRRRPDVEGVADGVRAEADRVLDGGVQRGQRLVVRRDVGLPVQLEDQRDLAGVLP
jgi:hypothetical protein